MNVLNLDKNGNNVPTKVFRNEESGKYVIQISKKVGEEYKNKYFPVEFLKDVELENGTDIIIKHAFLTFYDWNYNDRTGTTWLLKITAFDKANAEPVLKPESKTTMGSAKEIEVNDESELPFY